MSDFGDYDYDYDNVGRDSPVPPGGPPPDMDWEFYRDEDELAVDVVDPQHVPRPQLRSRPPIKFSESERRSTVGTLVGTDFGISAAVAARHPPSHMSGSTLRPSLNPSMPHPFSHKIHPPTNLPRPSIEVIASLTIVELHHNIHYRRLRQQYDHVSETLSIYVRNNNVESRVVRSDIVVPDIYQALARRDEDSRASSLGPSDSASQQKVDLAIDKAIEKLLESVEAPPMRPRFLLASVLWDLEDCDNDTSEGIIITDANKRRPKMNLAIRRPDGKKISSQEYVNVRRSADIIVQKLLNFVNSDTRNAAHPSKPRTKTFVKSVFRAEYQSAILELEAEQKLLRLCSAHWKADTMIGQAFMRRHDADGKAATHHGRAPFSKRNSSDARDSQPPETSPTALTPQVWQAVPMNVAKRAFELSPGPKSPSASQAQKRSKDDNAAVFGQKSTGPPRPSSQSQRPAARKIIPTFLSRADPLGAEPEPTKLPPVHVDPAAENLVAILESQFPSLANASRLLRSMNAQPSFKEGETSENVTTLLGQLQSADPDSPDIDEDNACESWGHYQFTAGGVSPSSSLTTWKDIGSVATAFKLVAAAIKTCQEARLMCTKAGNPKTAGFISDVYLEQTLDYLEKCWVDAGGTITCPRVPAVPTTPPSYRDVAMSPPAKRITIKFKRPTPVPDVSAIPNTSEAPGAATTTNSQQPTTGTGPTQEGPSDEGARADAASLKTLQVPELLAWINSNGLSVPKSKRKDDIIAAIVRSSEFAKVTDSMIEEIVQTRKLKKGTPI